MSVRLLAKKMTTLAIGTSVVFLRTIVGVARVAVASQNCKIVWMDASLVFLPPVRIRAQRRGTIVLALHQASNTQAARWGARSPSTQEASMSARPHAAKMITLAIGKSLAFLRTIVGVARKAIPSAYKSAWMVASLALGLLCLLGIIGMELQSNTELPCDSGFSIQSQILECGRIVFLLIAVALLSHRLRRT